MRRQLTRFLWTVLAAIFLVEAWIWDVLGGLLSRLVAFLPIDRTRRFLRGAIDRAPAPFALGLFLLPVLVLLPFKLAGLALMAKGRVGLGCVVFLIAKSAGLGVTAFIFDVCHERLMTMDWFARFYALVIAARDWAHRRVDPYRQAIRALRLRVMARLSARFASSAPSLAGRIATFRATLQGRARKMS